MTEQTENTTAANPADSRHQQRQQKLKHQVDERIKAATLDKALETFNGTQYFAGISKACQARADQMGWTPVNQNQQQALHH